MDLPQRWALQLTVEGDVRFLSHLDCVRAIERTAARGKVPLRFSQGFNPHPVLSLVPPRPVGVATRDDLLVLNLDEPMHGDDLLGRMNAHAPGGMRFTRAERIESRRSPHPQRIVHTLNLDESKLGQVATRVDRLLHMPAWTVERVKVAKRGKKTRRREIDLRNMLESINLNGATLRWTAKPQGDLWPKPTEVVELVGLNPKTELANVVRQTVEYDNQ